MASDTVNLKGYINLKVVASNLGICYEDIQVLNPSLKRFGIITNNSFYPVKLPADKIEAFKDNRENIVAEASKEGKSDLERLAKNSVGSTFGRDKVVYKVSSGDVLGIIAQKYKVRVTDIKKWNKLNSNVIRVGQHLDIWVYPGTQAVAVATKKTVNPVTVDYNGKKVYTVQPGDTLWDIANKYEGLDIEKIKELNKLKNSKIMPGQKLIIG